MKSWIVLFGGLVLLLAACQKGEIPVQKVDRGNVCTRTMDLGDKYKNQIWFKLNGNRIVSINSRSDWDLEFEADGRGNHVRLNEAKEMYALNTGKNKFSEVTDTFGFKNSKQCDRVASNDSIVIGQFESHSNVYLIDLGVDENNQRIGFKKLKFLENKSGSFTFCYANVFGDTTTKYAKFEKSPNYNFLQFSFVSGSLQSNIEPQKTDFDLEFTQYVYVFTNPYQPYWVTGVLLNRSNVTASVIENKSYESVTLKDTVSHPLTSKPDVIGYNWKQYDLAGAKYSYPLKVYIIKDVEGYFYKLRFITYTNNLGVNGYPEFEYQKL